MFCLTGKPQALIMTKENFNRSSNLNFKSAKRTKFLNDNCQNFLFANTSNKRTRSVKVSSRNGDSFKSKDSSSKDVRSYCSYKDLHLNWIGGKFEENKSVRDILFIF